MDYYGFPPELYQLKFKSKGDSKLAQRVVDLYERVSCIIVFPLNRDQCLL